MAKELTNRSKETVKEKEEAALNLKELGVDNLINLKRYDL